MSRGSWHIYWEKKNHVPKKLCSQLPCYDSFSVFKEESSLLNDHCNKVYARLEIDGFRGTCAGWPFFLAVSKQPCHFGGFRYFFQCTNCAARMRKVYLYRGHFECRKCLNLGYLSQRLNPSDRFLETMLKLKNHLPPRNYNFEHERDYERPRRMWKKTYEKIQLRISDLYWKSSRSLYLRYSDFRGDVNFQRIFGLVRQKTKRA